MLKTVAMIGLGTIMLSGCQTVDRHSQLQPITAHIPPSLLSACPGLSKIPHRDLSREETVKGWGADRTALLICARRHGALAKAVTVSEGAAK